MQATLDSSLANKRRRVPIKIIEPPSAVALTTSSAVPVPGPSKSQESRVLESSPRAAPYALSNSRTNTLEPISSRSIMLPEVDISSKNGPASLTTEKGLIDENPQSEVKSTNSQIQPSAPTLPPPSNSTNGAFKPNTFQDAKQARESAKPSRVGGGIFRASGNNTIFTPRENGDCTFENHPKSESSQSIGLSAKSDYNPVPKAPNTLFDFVKSWGSLRSTDEKWQLINVSTFGVIIHFLVLTPLLAPFYRVSLPPISQHCVKHLSNLARLHPSWRSSLINWILRKATPELKVSSESIWRIL